VKYARSALRQTVDRIGTVAVPGAALHFEHTLDLDGTVHAEEEAEENKEGMRSMFQALVAAHADSMAGERR
jgi:hypothetical protein